MAYVRQAGGLVDRAVAGVRRVTAANGSPYVAAGVLCLAAFTEVAFRPLGERENPSFALLFALAVTLPVALVRISPVVAAVLVGAAAIITSIGDGRAPLAGLVALVVVLFVVGRRRSRRAVALLLVPFIAYAAITLPTRDDRAFGVLLLLLATGAAVTGVALRARDEAVWRDASVRAMADSLLEHAARGERARIARELHDVVAHHISMIAVQAEAARLTTPGMPSDGARRLVAIADTARTALTEMRRLLGVLREDAGVEPTRRPQPGLQQLNDLLDEARGLGAGGTRLIVRGRVAPLDQGIELTAYRIVQEALTNARRHAPGAAVDVELLYGKDALHLRVRDNGPGPAAANGSVPDGHGLAGMRERAGMVGGRLSTGPAPLGGFLVEADLPIPETEP
jgi:signal transduction histidine kinase